MSQCLPSPTEIDLLRHGECVGGQIFRGTTDVALLSSGWDAMLKATQHTDQRWDRVIASPLKRCRLFAEAFAKQHQLPLHIDDRLREMSFGDWEGQAIETVWQKEPTLMQAWSHNPFRHTPPSGEPLEAVIARVQRFYQALMARFRGQKILLITHGGVIRVSLAEVLNIPPRDLNRFHIPYANLSRFAIYHAPVHDSREADNKNESGEGKSDSNLDSPTSWLQASDSVKLIAHNFADRDV